jgi:type IV secretion system protein VirB5
MFKRQTVRYGETQDPITPYQKAAQLWDERIGSARVQAKNWRLMAFALVLLSFALWGVIVWQAGQSRVTPYVVEVNEKGHVRAVGPAIKDYQPTDAQISYHLAQFVDKFRSLSADPIVVRKNWLSVYDFATDKAANRLSEHARANDPFAKVGKVTISVEVASIVRASKHSFQVRWRERLYENGALSATHRYTGVFSIIIKPPSDADTLRKNPLGVYVHNLNWSKDLSSQKK